MMRYNKTIELKTNRNGEQQLKTDFGQIWRIIPVKESNQFSSWLQAHHTDLREWQRDMLDIIHQGYNQYTGANPMHLHWVYQQGQGWQSQSECAFATVPNENLYILMTAQHTWVQASKFENLVFKVEDASGSVLEKQTRDEIWQLRDYLRHGKILVDKNYTDQDYTAQGLNT